ncbi:MAG: DUF3256 family protein [Muribaculaceae bacterium]|nr:DUF3256 family protein [Muribaculaceae bacterium]
MKKFLQLLPLLLLLPLTAWGQLTAEQAFIDAPSQLFPGIRRITRMDMVDYFKSGSDRGSTNRFGGLSRVLSLTPESIVVEVAESNIVEKQIALDCMAKGDTAIIFITNIATPAPDGAVKVYNSRWEPFAGTTFVEPTLKDWVKKGASKQQMQEVMGSVPFAMARYSFDPQTRLLVLTPSFTEFVPEDVMAKVKDSLCSSISYKWNGKRFVLYQKS